MQNTPQPQDLEIKFNVPTVSNDGHALAMNAEKGLCVINFIQMRPPKKDRAQADVVASVSFANIDVLNEFALDILRKIEERKKQEK